MDLLGGWEWWSTHPFYVSHLTQVNYSNNRTSPKDPPDLHRFTSSLLDSSVTWKDINWLKSAIYISTNCCERCFDY